MTGYKVTMTPDVTGWAPDDERAAIAGMHRGLWSQFTDPAKAYECMKSASALGWAVALEHLEEAT